MQLTIDTNTLHIMVGDLTQQKTDAIVNAANGSLLGGGGVDGAIHRAAGPELLEACTHIRESDLQGAYLPPGEVIMTRGYDLPATYVIHTVGPIWDATDEAVLNELLANCYGNALQLAKEKGLTSIAFPSISTGAYGFPIEKASAIALRTVYRFLRENTFGNVILTLFSPDDLHVYEDIVNNEYKD